MAITFDNVNNNVKSQGTGLSLVKGQRISLTKQAPGLKNILVGLGWDVKRYHGDADFDLDASVFMLGANGKVPSNDEFIFYGQTKYKNGSVEHTGDNRTGEGDGDDESIKVNLSMIPSNIERLVFTVTIYEAEKRKQNFGQVENAYIRIINEETGKEICRFDLGEEFSIVNSVNIGEIYKENNEWRFNSVGAGYANGLEGFVNDYGVILG